MSKNSPKLEKIKILDTTLREGHQSIHPLHISQGVVFTKEQQIEIAKHLINFKIDYIELGATINSDISADVAKEIIKLTKNTNTKVMAHCRCNKDDIEASINTGFHGLNLYFNISQHSTMNTDKANEMIVNAIKTLRKDHKEILLRFSFEDSFRTNPNNIYEILDQIHTELDRAGFPDTTGTVFPEAVRTRMKDIKKRYPNLEIECHFHNDLGLAPANTLTAILAGAEVMDVTSLGIGERTGITPLSALVGILTHHFGTDEIRKKYNIEALQDIDNAVAQALGINIPLSIPLTSPSAFTHVAGVHASAQTKNDKTYESLNHSDFGKESSICWASSVAGKSSIMYRANQLGKVINSDTAKDLASTIREKAKVQGGITAEEVDVLIKESSHA